jgi:hypothetical protein
MNDWRLSLAPHKCSHITFSKSHTNTSENLNLRLNNERIPYKEDPKFLGIVFDRRLNFERHFEQLGEKIKDRLNILKIVSYDKCWRLKSDTLINMFKVLLRSVLDYSSVISAACSKKTKESLEVAQNNALRIIFKKSPMDHVSIDTLRGWANVSSIEERHSALLNSYYEQALVSNNTLILKLFENYKKFRNRDVIGEELAVKENGEVNLKTLNDIRDHNRRCFNKIEIYPTTLCHAEVIIKNQITDNYPKPIGFGRG